MTGTGAIIVAADKVEAILGEVAGVPPRKNIAAHARFVAMSIYLAAVLCVCRARVGEAPKRPRVSGQVSTQAQ